MKSPDLAKLAIDETRKKLPRKARQALDEALRGALAREALASTKSSKEDALSIIAWALVNRADDLGFGLACDADAPSGEIREILGAARILGVFLNALASSRPAFRHGPTDTLCAALGDFPDLANESPRSKEVFRLAEMYAEVASRLGEQIKSIEDPEKRASLYEYCGAAVTLASKIGKIENVSAFARSEGSQRSSKARDTNAETARRRRAEVRQSVFDQLDANPDKSDGQIAVTLMRDFPELYPRRHGKQPEKKPKRDADSLRKEWAARK